MEQASEIPAKKVSIVIPTLNESGNIDPLLTEVLKHAGDERDVEIIIVDDGSTDGTRDKVRNWSASHPVRLVERDNERGLTGAVLAGAAVAKADIILVMDADLSHPPSAIPSLIQPIADDQADMVIGSRYIPGGGCEGWPAKRKIMSRGAALMAWPFTDAKDPLAGFFAVRKDKILAIDQGREGFKISLEILMRWRDSLRVAERPITFKDREYGTSKLGSKVMINYLSRLAAHAGGVFNAALLGRFILTTLLAAIVDIAALAMLNTREIWFGSSHIVSLSAGLVVALPVYWRWVFQPKYRRPGAIGPLVDYLILAASAVMLRGGLLDVLVAKFGLPVVPSACIGWLIMAGILYAGLAFWVFSPTMAGLSAPSRWTTASIGVIAFMVLTRLLYLGGPGLIPEEAYYCSYAAHPDIGYLDHPPMVAWLIMAGTSVFGMNEFGARIGSFICWLIAGGFIFAVTRNIFGKPAGLRAVMLMSILPYFVGNGLLITPDCPLVACWAGVIYFLERAILAGRKSAWLGVGVFMGLGLLSKYTIALLGMAALVAVLLDRRARRALLGWQIWTAVLIAVAIFTPVILWNAQHDWASFLFQTSRRTGAPPSFNTHYLLLYAVIQLFPTGLAAVIHCLASKTGRPALPDNNPIDQPSERSIRLFLLALTIVPLAVFTYFSIKHKVQPNWTGPIWLAALPFVAYHMALPAGVPERAVGRIIRQCWGPTVAILVLLTVAAAHYITLGLPKIPFPADQDKLAMNDLARQVASVADGIREKTGQMPVIVGMDKYQAASELAFYVPQYGRYKGEYQFASSSTISNDNESSLMWNFWVDYKLLNGRTFVMAGPDPDSLAQPLLILYFRSLEPKPQQKLDLRLNGKFVRNYYLQVGENYSAEFHRQFMESSRNTSQPAPK